MMSTSKFLLELGQVILVVGLSIFLSYIMVWYVLIWSPNKVLTGEPMTSVVKITAHCSPQKQVRIMTTDREGTEEIILEDGESFEYYVYDERRITVNEMEVPIGGS
jgi:hypothetical protein